jgi:AdoMet-dependent heme synthase
MTPLSFVFPERPQRVYWETTRSCDLACRHCRAEAAPDADPEELRPAEGLALIDQLAAFGPPLPHLVFTGGDPLKRADLFDLIAAARRRGFQVSVAPSATPLLTADALRHLREAGVDAISLSIDGSNAARHDFIRGIPGTFERTLGAARAARDVQLPFQINTLVCDETVDDLPAIHQLAMNLGAARWSLFFLVSVGRGLVLQPVTPERAEALLVWLASLAGPPRPGRLVITTTEAPFFRRVVSQRRPESMAHRPTTESGTDGSTRTVGHGAGIRDGNGIMFISHTGEICPSGFLEIPTGNVRHDDVVDVYRHHPLFESLRKPEEFHGRCGPCEFRWVCGGSRARAYSASSDPLGEDPLCEHQPQVLA